MTTEFKRAQGDLERANKLLESLSGSETVLQSEFVVLKQVLETLVSDATGFRSKREQTITVDDPEAPGSQKEIPKYYGPKMAEKVLGFEQEVKDLQNRFESFSQTAEISFVEHVQPVRSIQESQPQTIIPPSAGLQSIRESDAELARRRREDEERNAKLALEALQKVTEQTKIAEEQDPLKLEQKVYDQLSFTKGIAGFTQTLAFVDKSNAKHLCSILDVITKNPENIQYRTLSLGNPSVKALLDGEGIRECLASVGFKPLMLTDPKTQEQQVSYFLREPSVETDFDSWSVWFETLKAALDLARQSTR